MNCHFDAEILSARPRDSELIYDLAAANCGCVFEVSGLPWRAAVAAGSGKGIAGRTRIPIVIEGASPSPDPNEPAWIDVTGRWRLDGPGGRPLLIGRALVPTALPSNLLRRLRRDLHRPMPCAAVLLLRRLDDWWSFLG